MLIEYTAGIQSTVSNMESAIFPFYLHTFFPDKKLSGQIRGENGRGGDKNFF